MGETGLDETKILLFRARLLRLIVSSTAVISSQPDDAFSLFTKAYQYIINSEPNTAYRVLHPAGSFLVNRILANAPSTSSSELYDTFLKSTKAWSAQERGVEAILWLHHPTRPSATPGITLIRDPGGVAKQVPAASPKRRKLLVHLCLSTARQSLADQNFVDAQFVLEFAKHNFPDLVNPPPEDKQTQANAKPSASQKQRVEEENLRMLDQLLPA